MTSRTGTDGFSLIEVLVASVILFAGLGAVLRAYSLAANALDSAQDVMASYALLEEQASVLDLQVRTVGGPLTGGSGRVFPHGTPYIWEVTTRREGLSPSLTRETARIRVSRLAGGVPRSVDCEWAVFTEPRQAEGGR